MEWSRALAEQAAVVVYDGPWETGPDNGWDSDESVDIVVYEAGW
jgi:hypothetical protein